MDRTDTQMSSDRPDVVFGCLDREMTAALEDAKTEVARRDMPDIWVVWHSWFTVTRPPETEEE